MAARSFARTSKTPCMRIAGTDRYAVITQSLRDTPTGTELLIHATPKGYGPPFLLPSLDLHNIDANSFALALRLRVAVYDTPLPNSEVRFDVGVGTDQSIGDRALQAPRPPRPVRRAARLLHSHRH